MELFESIVYKNPDLSKFSPKLQDLLRKLLCKDPNKRLGHITARDVTDHPWFEKINW
jgi:serine/threonine protein kinase